MCRAHCDLFLLQSIEGNVMESVSSSTVVTLIVMCAYSLGQNIAEHVNST